MDTSMTLPPAPTHVRTSNPLSRALRMPFELRTWKETIHLLLNLPIGIATFTIVVTGFALGFGLIITLIGRLSRRWIVSFHVRSSNGIRSARESGFDVRTCVGAGGRVIEVSMVAG